jgi:hypothetical protein
MNQHAITSPERVTEPRARTIGTDHDPRAKTLSTGDEFTGTRIDSRDHGGQAAVRASRASEIDLVTVETGAIDHMARERCAQVRARVLDGSPHTPHGLRERAAECRVVLTNQAGHEFGTLHRLPGDALAVEGDDPATLRGCDLRCASAGRSETEYRDIDVDRHPADRAIAITPPP